MTDNGHKHLGMPLGKARVIFVFVHGCSQSPEAMQEIVIRHLATPGVVYVLPSAPQGSWYAAHVVDPLSDDSLNWAGRWRSCTGRLGRRWRRRRGCRCCWVGSVRGRVWRWNWPSPTAHGRGPWSR